MDILKPDIVIYHGGCPDGLGGAWAFWRVYKDTVEYFPGRFQQDPPDVIDKNVVFVDFSYSLDVTLEMSKQAKSITVLDHHKTAKPLLKLCECKTPCQFNITLDMSKSGAQIAWDYLNAGEARPWFINDIGDRDLWRWEIPDSKASTRAMFSQGHYENFDTFDQIQTRPRSEFVALGQTLIKEDQRIYSRICKNATDCMISTLDGKQSYKCRVVECNRMFGSDVGNLLVQDGKCDFSVMYRYILERDEWWLSLRAKKGMGIDLTTILEPLFGNGGGHALASGCTIFGSKGKSLKDYFKPVSKDSIFHLPLVNHNTNSIEPSQPLSTAESADLLTQSNPV